MSDFQSKFWPGFDSAFKAGRYLKPAPQLHGLSISSVMLNMYFGDTLLAKGTGWFWKVPEGIALVTAWHNFSGLHHTKRTPLSQSAGLPDRIRFRYMTRNPQTFQDVEIPLFMDAERTKPRWFVHPICGNYFDMAFLMLNIQGGNIGCINDTVSVLQSDLRPGSYVFSIGFPQGIGPLGVFAVWKRGSVATDPDMLVEGHPKFFVDMAGRGGLSGAPVFQIQKGLISEPTPNGQLISFGEKMEFVGLYSGRAADQLPVQSRAGESSDLGFVWRADVVTEMLHGDVLDELPEVGKGALEIREIWEKRPDS